MSVSILFEARKGRSPFGWVGAPVFNAGSLWEGFTVGRGAIWSREAGSASQRPCQRLLVGRGKGAETGTLKGMRNPVGVSHTLEGDEVEMSWVIWARCVCLGGG